MDMDTPLYHRPELPGLKHLYSGKVRELYEIDADRLLIVATDRISAFDMVLPDPVPGKGRILTRMSGFWCQRAHTLIDSHLSGVAPCYTLGDAAADALQERAMVVKKLRPLPVEAIVRGYLAGSGWKDYIATGHISGIRLPGKLKLAAQLPESIFTPSTKATRGEHDCNIDFEQMTKLVGDNHARHIREVSLRLYAEACVYARERGIIIADTKFEFGTDSAGRLHLMDEVLTPDSSRFWSVQDWHPGTNPPSLDKQYIRDYLDSLGWDRHAPAPRLPEEVIHKTVEKYQQAADHLL